jgi:hypothetical protein
MDVVQGERSPWSSSLAQRRMRRRDSQLQVRCYAPSDSFYERCIGLAWCSGCREYSGAMVYVPPGEHLTDVLADLPAVQRDRLARSEVKLLDYLDRLTRRGAWPPLER